MRTLGPLAVLLACLNGCAHQASSNKRERTVEAPPAPAKRVKLAVLPVESDRFPRVAQMMNGLFRDVRVPGVDDYFLSKVTLEVVQLSIECVDPTSACYVQVGKSLAAERLLLAHLEAGPPPPKARKRDRVPSVRVTLTLFDVEGGAAVSVIERTFKNESEATNGLAELVQELAAPSDAAKAEAAPPGPVSESTVAQPIGKGGAVKGAGGR